jgi:hypothetical protein
VFSHTGSAPHIPLDEVRYPTARRSPRARGWLFWRVPAIHHDVARGMTPGMRLHDHHVPRGGLVLVPVIGDEANKAPSLKIRAVLARVVGPRGQVHAARFEREPHVAGARARGVTHGDVAELLDRSTRVKAGHGVGIPIMLRPGG